MSNSKVEAAIYQDGKTLKKDQVWERKLQESGFGDVIFDMPISQSLKQRSTLVSMSDNCWQSLLQAEGMNSWLCVLLWLDHILITNISYYILSYIHVSYTNTGRADENIGLRKSDAG